MTKIKLILFFIITGFLNLSSHGQSNNATLKGVVSDPSGIPLDMVNIGLKDYPIGTSSNRKGEFLLRVPARKDVVVVFSSIGYRPLVDTIHADAEETVFRKSPSKPITGTGRVMVTEQRRSGGTFPASTRNLWMCCPTRLPGPWKPSSNVALRFNQQRIKFQYTVRGGNFDENLVYVNDIEVYRHS
jgi:hypothetical protein